MPTECSATLFEFAPVEGRRVVAAFDGGAITSDAGALLLGATDRAIGLVERFAACFARRAGRRSGSSTRSRPWSASGCSASRSGYEDLRRPRPAAPRPGAGDARRQARGPAPRLRAAGRQEHAEPARARAGAASPTATTGSATTARRSRRCSSTCSSMPTRKAAGGRSSSTSMPPTIRCTGIRRAGSSTATTTATATCRSTSSAAGTCWRPSCGASNIDASAGAVEEVERIVGQIRARWPRVRILLRADSGFAREALMAWCEAQPRRLRVRPGPQRPAGRANSHIDARLGARHEADAHRQAGPPLQATSAGRRSTAGAAGAASSPRPNGPMARPIRASSSPRWAPPRCDARSLYEHIYCARGEMENRIKECQLDLFADRTSAATMRANQLRLWFASMAYVLLCALRRIGLAHTQFADATCGTHPPRSCSRSAPWSASASAASRSPWPRRIRASPSSPSPRPA